MGPLNSVIGMNPANLGCQPQQVLAPTATDPVVRTLASTPRSNPTRTLTMRCAAGEASCKLESSARYRPLIENTMSPFPDEPRFLAAVDEVFAAIEESLDATGQDLDLDCARHGPVLEITFEDHSRVILNAQAPLHEIWLASRAGGRHFRCADNGTWIDTRSSETLETALSSALSGHAGETVVIPPLRSL